MRSKDRLAELQQLAASAGGVVGAAPAVYRDTVELALKPSPGHADIDALFMQVERMRGWIHELNGNTQLMCRLRADPTFHTNKHLQDQLESVIAQSNGIGVQVCDALRALEGAAAARAAGNDARSRIVRLQYAATRRLYADALARHQAALDALRDTQLRLLHEQIKLTNLTISDEECQSLLESKNISLFVDNVRAETAEARRLLRDVEARHEELARLESSLRDVRDLFAQLAHLIAAQQDRVDSVEYYALQATEHVEDGQHQLFKGTVSRTKARRNKMSLILCLSAGFLVVLLVLVFT